MSPKEYTDPNIAGASKVILKKDLVWVQYATSDKQILVPSLATTSKVFNQHLTILRDMKLKIDELKQAYFSQMDHQRSWKKVD
mmetsp:Transcript_34621/g.52958  ORF Transcript_34621/g.52958 Transcript_34621/m.52958 type:complete len:83 (+) Transcript_34621:3717-3965(+)